MIYETKLIREILGGKSESEEAKKILDEVSPVYGEAYVCLHLFRIIGNVLDEIARFPERLQKQTVVQTADEEWALEYWEGQYGLKTDASISFAERRRTLLEKIKKGFRNPRQLEEALEAITGFQVQIEENTGKNQFNVLVCGYLEDLSEVKNFIEKVKPAHLIYDVRASELIEMVVNLYYGCAVSEHEYFEVEVEGAKE